MTTPLAGISQAAVTAKLKILADAAKYDASCASSGAQRKRDPNGLGNSEGMGICHSYTPDGRCVSLLKILLTNYCVYDCKFCINRISSNVARARFTPEEVVWLTMEFYRRNYIEGLFLSSGIIDSPDATMLLLIRVAKSLRTEHRFNGYIHLKVVPGASRELVEEAGLWADRVSANVELAVQKDLDKLAPAKKITTAETTMSQVRVRLDEAKEDKKRMKRPPRFAPAGQTTQMIVGATPTTDAEVLDTSSRLYSTHHLRRIYFSAYSPIPDADATLPVRPPALVRENRLYQADWLMRFYGFAAKELTSSTEPNLSLDFDPKTAWALRNRSFFPVDLNSAPREQLLRVPGLGVKTVEKIIQCRRLARIRLVDLVTMRVPFQRVKYFVRTSDHNPSAYLIDRNDLPDRLNTKDKQLSLFSPLEKPA